MQLVLKRNSHGPVFTMKLILQKSELISDQILGLIT